MESEKIELKHIEGQFLLRYANAKVPPELGDEKFDLGVVSNGNDQIVMLRRDLRAYSPIIQRHQKPCFGDAGNWTKKITSVLCAKCKDASVKDDESWNMTDPDKRISVKFSEDAVGGVYWCLLLALHPLSSHLAANAEIDEIVMPLARKFGWLSELKRAIKLDRAKAKTLVREKPEPDPLPETEKAIT
jgi:hypothetical protein